MSSTLDPATGAPGGPPLMSTVGGVATPGAPPPVAEARVPLPGTARRHYRAARNGRASVPFEFDFEDGAAAFVAYPGRAPATVEIDFGGIATTGDTRAMWDYFRAVMTPESEFLRLKAYLDDPANEIDADLLSQILVDMLEFANGLPTGPSSS